MSPPLSYTVSDAWNFIARAKKQHVHSSGYFREKKIGFEGSIWSSSTLILRNNRESAKKIASQKIVFVEPWGFLHRIGIHTRTQEQTTQSFTNPTLMCPWKVRLCLYLIKTKQHFRSSFLFYHLQDFILLKAPAV